MIRFTILRLKPGTSVKVLVWKPDIPNEARCITLLLISRHGLRQASERLYCHCIGSIAHAYKLPGGNIPSSLQNIYPTTVRPQRYKSFGKEARGVKARSWLTNLLHGNLDMHTRPRNIKAQVRRGKGWKNSFMIIKFVSSQSRHAHEDTLLGLKKKVLIHFDRLVWRRVYVP